jgi:4,5-dihydroxyphthalate decarboxylase
MTKLTLAVAIGDYDRTRPLTDGAIEIDGVDPVYMKLSPEEIFFRAFRHQEFDICELSFSSYTLKVSTGDCPYVAVPAFVSRAFRHTSICVRTDCGIRSPKDLAGRRIGTPEYQLTANVWARAILEEDFGVRPSDVIWVRGGLEEPGRPEKISITLPPEIRTDSAPEGRSLNDMLSKGEIDGFMGPRAPSILGRDPNVKWLFDNPTAAALENFHRTGIFPIMHVIGVRKTLVEANPWLPSAVLKAFQQAKDAALVKLSDTSAPKVMLPFVEEQLASAQREMGEDYWPYGVAKNKATIEYFLKHHHSQGLSKRLVSLGELFAPSTYETVKV